MIPLFESQQIRDADKFAIDKLKIPGMVLMENAARSILKAIENIPELSREFDSFGIVCGKGNNGGDGYALARLLVNEGYSVKVISIGTGSNLKGDAKLNFTILKNLAGYNENVKILQYRNIRDLNNIGNCTIIIDALLGTGTKGELKEPYSSIITKLNKFEAYRIAIDLPSGLDSSTSTGSLIFDADLTITLAELKTALFYGEGYKHSGETIKGSIGIGPEFFDGLPVNSYLVEPEDALSGLPQNRLDDHKYSAGKVLVIAGSGHLPGAAFLTTNAVLKSGAGSAILAFPKSMKLLAQQKLVEAVVHPYNDEGQEYLSTSNIDELRDRISWADVVAIGPGLGREADTLEAVRKIIKEFPSKKFIIDADAVVALSEGGINNLDLKGKVLTPHNQEFAALLGIPVKKLKENILLHGTKFAASSGAYIVLKGAPTITFTPEGEVLINSSGNPGMAQFGSGDVLTGMLAAFLSKSDIIEDSVISGVYIHSLSADLLIESKTELGYTANDILENIPDAIKFIQDSFI
jgi:NAD(P)H-hydrate epimerase